MSLGPALQTHATADCFMCHNAGKNTSLSTMSRKPSKEMLKAIRDGVENTLMPGFAVSNGGPLDDADIQSLIELINP
ncbi:MAG: c-type cytochrome [Thermodesulfovibrionales bacterium]